MDCICRIQFPNLFAEEKRDILIKLKLPSGTGGEPVLQAQLEYTDGATLQRITKDPAGVVLDRSSSTPVTETPEREVETADLRYTTAEVSKSEISVDINTFVKIITLEVICPYDSYCI